MGGGWSKVLIVLFLRAINNSEPYANGVQMILIWDRDRAGLPESVPDLLVRAVCVNAHVRICAGGAQR